MNRGENAGYLSKLYLTCIFEKQHWLVLYLVKISNVKVQNKNEAQKKSSPCLT